MDSEQELFEEMLSKFAPRAFRAAVAILGERHEAEDAVQEAAIQAFQSLEQLRDQRAFGAWFVRITVNKAIDIVRRRKRAQEPAFDPSWVPSPQSALDLETVMDVTQAVEQLPLEHRTVVHLYYAGGYLTPEIARLLNRPEGTVRRLLSESYRMLRKLLSPTPRGS